MAVGIQSSMVDTAFKAVLDICSAGGPVTVHVGNVVLHSCLRVDLELNWTDGSSQAGINLTSIFVVVVILGTTSSVR